MSLSRHFQFVLSEAEHGAIRRLQDREHDRDYVLSGLVRNDTAHLRNVLKRLDDAYTAANPGTPHPEPARTLP